jgi:hypothetical protein
VLAGGGVQAIVRDAEAFYGLVAQNVGLNDFLGVGHGHVAVPDCLGIDDDVRAVLALVEASGLVGTDDRARNSGEGEKTLELAMEIVASRRIAARARTANGTLVAADEDVLSEFRQ